MEGFRVGELVVDLAQPMRVREICEAEKALGMGMQDSGTARIAVYIFVTLRKQDPERSAVLIADEVMGMDMTQLDELGEDAASPPAVPEADPMSPPTSGPRLSALSESA
jgi:hypothetical protein